MTGFGVTCASGNRRGVCTEPLTHDGGGIPVRGPGATGLMEFTGNIYTSGTAGPAAPPRRRAIRPAGPLLSERTNAETLGFFEWLFGQVQLDFGAYRVGPLLRRLPACLRFLRASDIPAAVRRLDAYPALIPSVVSTALLGVTRFHRDQAVFDAIADHVLPELLLGGPKVRVWSAACSDGPELYSVAMLIEEAGRLARAELIGSDCRPDAIRRAVAGLYPVAALENFSSCRRSEHFVTVRDGLVQVNDSLRAAVNWRVSDLLTGAIPGEWDLVLWRNMSIYLTPAAADRCWEIVTNPLRVGGFLVTGKADHPPASLPLRRVAPCIYKKTSGVRHA